MTEKKSTQHPGEYILPFGKYRGERLYDIPITYLDHILGWEELFDGTRKKIEAFLSTQAEHQKEPDDWKEGREDYVEDED